MNVLSKSVLLLASAMLYAAEKHSLENSFSMQEQPTPSSEQTIDTQLKAFWKCEDRCFRSIPAFGSYHSRNRNLTTEQAIAYGQCLRFCVWYAKQSPIPAPSSTAAVAKPAQQIALQLPNKSIGNPRQSHPGLTEHHALATMNDSTVAVRQYQAAQALARE